MSTVYFPIIRTIFAYLLLLICVRLMGQKAISQMTVFNLTVMITLGSVTATVALGEDYSSFSATTVLLTLSVLAIITDYLHLKSLRFRKLTNSEPVTVIANGTINDKNLKKIRMTMDELTTLLRTKNVFNVSDVEFAIIENSGDLSVLPKSPKQPLTPSDLHLPTKYKGLTADIIIDGKIMEENLKSAHRDIEWLRNQLKSQGITNFKEVFYAGLDTSGNIYISKKIKGSETEGQYGIE